MANWDEMIVRLNEKNSAVAENLKTASDALSNRATVIHYKPLAEFYVQPTYVEELPTQYKIIVKAHFEFRDYLEMKRSTDIIKAFVERAKKLGANALLDVHEVEGNLVAVPAFMVEIAAEDKFYELKAREFKKNIEHLKSDRLYISEERKRIRELEKQVSDLRSKISYKEGYKKGFDDGYDEGSFNGWPSSACGNYLYEW